MADTDRKRMRFSTRGAGRSDRRSLARRLLPNSATMAKWAASLVPLTRHSDLHADECSPRALSAGCIAPPLLRVVKGATAR